MTNTLSILERRRIEAEIIKPIYDELVARFGTDEAKAVIGTAVRQNSIRQAESFRTELGENSGLEGFYSTLHLWTMNGALEIEVKAQSATALDYDVTRCQYAEMYREMGLAEIGHLLSCQRDAVFCKGIDPRIEMERTQTIMGGADHCDFRYRLAEPESSSGQ
ncbi:L-2-amino-thiazoline-4-carboxylic acid hydrolase [Xanthobacteraceae bacterium A53D]